MEKIRDLFKSALCAPPREGEGSSNLSPEQKGLRTHSRPEGLQFYEELELQKQKLLFSSIEKRKNKLLGLHDGSLQFLLVDFQEVEEEGEFLSVKNWLKILEKENRKLLIE